VSGFTDSGIIQKWQLFTKFEIEGREIFTGKSPNLGNGLNDLYVSLRYIYLAKEVLKYMGINLQFNSNFEYSADIHDFLGKICQVIYGQNKYTAVEIDGNPSCVIIADDQLSNIDILANVTEATSIKFEQQLAHAVNIFGVKITMPKLVHIFTKVKPRLVGDINSIIPNQEVSVEWVPEDDCQYIINVMT